MMTQKNRTLEFFILGLSLIGNVNAQEFRDVVNSSGGFTQTPNYQLQFSLGEVRVGTVFQSQLTLHEGFLQSDFKRNLSLGLEKRTISSIIIYPNPATDQVSILDTEMKLISTSVYNMQGKFISQIPIENNTLYISHLRIGRYQLLFYDNEEVLRSVSILIKN